IVCTTGDWETKGNHNHISENLAIRSQVGDAMHLQASYLTLFGRGNFDVVNLVSPMDGHCQVFTAVFNPLHGMACLHGSVSCYQFFWVDIELGAKTASDLRHNNANLMLGKANRSGQNVAQ